MNVALLFISFLFIVVDKGVSVTCRGRLSLHEMANPFQ